MWLRNHVFSKLEELLFETNQIDREVKTKLAQWMKDPRWSQMGKASSLDTKVWTDDIIRQLKAYHKRQKDLLAKAKFYSFLAKLFI